VNPRLPDPSTLFPWRAWTRDPALRSWTTWLFVALVAVPPLALTLLPTNGDDVQVPASVFAAYFATAWFLVLWIVVRPQSVAGAMLAQVVVIALLVEGPLAVGLETVLNADHGNVLQSIVTIGVPEELAKMVPVVAVLLWRRSVDRPLPPRDALFLGAVSGLAFGAVEAVVYVGDSASTLSSGDALVVVWRLLTDPVAHACWAGVAGYFLGLASYYRAPGPWFALAGVGLGVPAVLHGINDVVAGGALWVVVTVVSALLFLAYARIGIASGSAPVPVDPPTAPIALPPSHRVSNESVKPAMYRVSAGSTGHVSIGGHHS
jgi:RsiW-degrading membrane proteinase PrsW (M82 family)